MKIDIIGNQLGLLNQRDLCSKFSGVKLQRSKANDIPISTTNQGNL